ncbi:MAG: tetratricopeptide repeat protein [Candidatus Nealsonbacteria bacterium]|nr:tetratricopeptide repeat protein [Candidatus Nealsonbacteria bacterium]
MSIFGEHPKFEIQPVIEQKPFENPAVQSFFKKWCEINDSIEPKVVDRKEYERKAAESIMEKRPDNKQALYIPKDLQLWEMVGVVEAIDRDTFKQKPERQTKKKEKILELGKTFSDAGVYIAKRLNSIGQGKKIAGALAEEFYNYGELLIRGRKTRGKAGIKDIASKNLTPKEVNIIDRWLAGDDLYESRQKKAEQAAGANPQKRNDFYEAERRKTLAQFFRVAQKAFGLKQKSGEQLAPAARSRLKPWQSDATFHSAFLRKVEGAIRKQIEAPKRELEGSIFRRGMELLQRNMPFDKLPDWVKNDYLHWQGGEKTLREALQIDRLKAELKTVQQSGYVAQISAKEREIADKIQISVSNFQRKSSANNPSEMAANQYINCVGASMLGGALMQEAGLNYLVGNVPRHSILFLVTSDGRVEFRDMLNFQLNEDLADEMIAGKKKDGSPLKVADVMAFSKKPTSEGLMFDINRKKYGEAWFRKGERQYVAVFEPEYGQQIQVLNNTGNVLDNLGRKEEAIEAYRQAIAVDPKYAYPYYGLGNVLKDLGRKEEAIEAYQKFLDLADRQKDDIWMKQAEGRITRLENKK